MINCIHFIAFRLWFIHNFWSESVEYGFLPIPKHFDFLGFIPKLFSVAHFSTSDNILLLIRTQACISVTGLLTYIWTLSAYKYTSHSDRILGRSLTYIENNKGPSTEPCGTPLDKFRREETCVPETTA